MPWVRVSTKNMNYNTYPSKKNPSKKNSITSPTPPSTHYHKLPNMEVKTLHLYGNALPTFNSWGRILIICYPIAAFLINQTLQRHPPVFPWGRWHVCSSFFSIACIFHVVSNEGLLHDSADKVAWEKGTLTVRMCTGRCNYQALSSESEPVIALNASSEYKDH